MVCHLANFPNYNIKTGPTNTKSVEPVIRVGLFVKIVSRGRGARTPIYGFGDRCSTIELFPFVGYISEPQ